MWTDQLKINPIPTLLDGEDKALQYFTERDLLGLEVETAGEALWELKAPVEILRRQRMDGAWVYRGNRPGDEFGENYELLETWKNLRFLVEMYGFDRRHAAIQRAADFIFACQTREGDIRGILANQYMPYYMGAIMEILIKAGYGEDERILKGFQWLLDMRQADGGWIIPLQLYKIQEFYRVYNRAPIPPEKNKPFSHMASGMVIRAFAAHAEYGRRPEAQHAGRLLKGRMFQADVYTSRQAIAYWYKLQFPFWWTSLLTVLDSLMRMDFILDDEIRQGLDWFIQNQDHDGTWHTSYGGLKGTRPTGWVTLAVCRILKHYLP